MKSIFETFNSRQDEEELMDLPATTREEFTQALYDIQWVNKNLGGIRILLEEVMSLLPQLPETNDMVRTYYILDLGTGSADIPMALVQWARKNRDKYKIQFHITAVDLHPVAIELSRQIASAFPEIEVRQGDALNLQDADQTYDIIISSMFMHHLKNDEAVKLLQEMARMARLGFIINDLERHPLAYLSICLLGHLTRKGKVFLNDAPLSVQRGFTKKDLEELRELSNLKGMQIHHHKPYRWTLVWKRNPA